MANRLRELIVAELVERYKNLNHCLVVGYHGMTAEESNALRRALAQQGFRMEVLRNAMALRAFQAIGLANLGQFIVGPSAIVRGDGDVTLLCKTIVNWAKQNEKLVIRGGLLDRVPISEQQVRALASIPPIEVLRAQILAGIQTPLARVSGAFQSVIRALGRALEAIRAAKAKAEEQSQAKAGGN